ncbi:MAG TPA: MaoC family dehydratase [archaeon]|nr:MaoC family dehydratase [archaeon]
MQQCSFSSLKIGDKGEIKRIFTESDVIRFSELSLDTNPVHIDKDFAEKTVFGERIVHGMLVASLISAVVGTKMPGTGSIWIDQNLRFLKPVKINDEIRAVSELIAKIPERQQVIIRTACYNQKNELVVEGEGLHKILNP